ncbi:hypothetical protein [Plebeiibacterium marinum]|uniref:Vitellogenin II n=1 Tax=Plebeiibacterium marinum TaxID=2992111 RepID=A0AAE3MC01_9BACT|nr:hypothetical protein [Plebeiobacterium marinum]MCW3804799.1 hypothetical protein [Plebeiobacterium marinum]
MKKIIQISAVALFALTSCATYQNSASVYEDDLYYSPSDKPISIAEGYSSLPSPDKQVQKEDNKTYSHLKSSYQQTPQAKVNEDLRDFSGIQQEYTSLLTNDSVQDVDTLLYYNEQTGYWVNEFEGSQMDKDYAERIARFHGPMRGIPYWSPLYDEVIFNSGFDYNVYIDGDYAFVVPEWHSRYYWDWRYSRPYSNYGFYGYYGWNSPWYSNWGWGIGFGYYDYSYPYWGWGYPYHYGGYYGGHYPYHGHYAKNNFYRERAPREVYSDRVRSSRQISTNKAATQSSGTGNIGRTSRVAQTTSNPAATKTYSSRTTRASYNRAASATTKSSQVSGNTRSTSTPTYTRTSGRSNTRSTYNTNSSRTNNTAPTRTYSNSSSNKSSYSNSRSSSNRTYNTGSSRSRSSSYNNTRSSTPTRTYSPSYNSSTRSSSSSYSSGSRSSSSSSSGTRSSGSSSRSSSGSSRSSRGR